MGHFSAPAVLFGRGAGHTDRHHHVINVHVIVLTDTESPARGSGSSYRIRSTCQTPEDATQTTATTINSCSSSSSSRSSAVRITALYSNRFLVR
jgi:hypothetical protein